MVLSPMRYKNFVWPHNPRVYSIDFTRHVAAKKVPFGDYILQDLGLGHRVLRGEALSLGGRRLGEKAVLERWEEDGD